MHKQNVLPFPIIMLAVQGDNVAINQVLKHFERYILRLSQKTLFDDTGTPHYHVELEMKSQLELHLITAILRFEIR